MTDEEITEFANLVEETWLENIAARKYLREHCNITDPVKVLSEEIKKIPQDSQFYRYFAPIRQAIARGLHDTEYVDKLGKAILEFSKQSKG
jgi:hypothetical protein